MRDAVSELNMFSRFFLDGGEEGDGTDYGLPPHLDGVYRQNPDADRVWDDAEPLAALIAKEADIDDEDENLGDDADFGILGDGRIDYELLAMQEINLAEVVVATSEPLPGEDDTRQGGVIGLSRLAHLEQGPYQAGYHLGRPDNFRRKRQAVKRPRRDAARAKEVVVAA